MRKIRNVNPQQEITEKQVELSLRNRQLRRKTNDYFHALNAKREIRYDSPIQNQDTSINSCGINKYNLSKIIIEDNTRCRHKKRLSYRNKMIDTYLSSPNLTDPS